MDNNKRLPADKKYDPIGCQHKHANGFSAWSFQSESSGSGPEIDYHVSIHVCHLCGEIRVAGRRWDGKSNHVDHFCEEFNIYHPGAIDAIIKQANFYNEEAKWGRLSQPPAVKGAVWVKVSDRPLIKQYGETWYNTKDGDGDFIAAVPYKRKGHGDKIFWWTRHCCIDNGRLCVVGDDDNDIAGWEVDAVEYWMPWPQNPDESPTAAGDGKEDAVAFADWGRDNVKGYDPIAEKWVYGEDEQRFTTTELYNIFKNDRSRKDPE